MQYNPFPVTIDGQLMDQPFIGGLDSPKLSLIDWNNDGLIDLMIGEPNGKLRYFRNTGTKQFPKFLLEYDRFGGIDIGTWHTFHDIDGDGDLDLFCDARNAYTAFWENRGTSSDISFEFISEKYSDFPTGVYTTPAFADLDGDGDDDFFLGGLAGNLKFYENIGDKFNPEFVFANDLYDSIIAFPIFAGRSPDNPEHGFSVIKFADTDNDNDLDLYWGDINNPHLYYFQNNGDSSLSDLTYVTENLLPDTWVGFNHPALADIDDDNDLDMLLGVATASNNMQLFRNNGTPEQAIFEIEDSAFVKTFDNGSNTKPTFGDLDDDGDLDMLVGSSQHGLVYFENIGTKSNPSFNLVSTNYKNIDASTNTAPTLVDWDNDNDLDLLIGNTSGKIEYWRNDGDNTNFQPIKVSSQLAGIQVDQVAVPVVADLNEDGLNDLLVGEWDYNGFANLLLYENVGSPTNPQLQLVTKRLLKRANREVAIPQVIDWDRDGKLDIVFGERLYGLTLLRNISARGEFPDSLTLIPQLDTIPGYDDGRRTTVEFVDIDDDGDIDVFTGEGDGGINFHRQLGSCCLGMRGNVDYDPTDFIDINDLTKLIDFLFISFTPPACMEEANIDGSTDGISVDIQDLTLLIDYLFISYTPPIDCP